VAERMKRTQVLFPEEEYRRLREVAQAKHCSVSHLVREAVAKQYLRSPRKGRQEAARRLVEMKVPVADWSEMEQEIARGSHPRRRDAGNGSRADRHRGPALRPRK
jgi:hypothetical protein